MIFGCNSVQDPSLLRLQRAVALVGEATLYAVFPWEGRHAELLAAERAQTAYRQV
jgi:hypothetical protein